MFHLPDEDRLRDDLVREERQHEQYLQHDDMVSAYSCDLLDQVLQLLLEVHRDDLLQVKPDDRQVQDNSIL